MRILFLISVLFLSHYTLAEKYDSIYGLTLGDEINKAIKLFGEPDQVVSLEDGAIARAFVKEDHYIAIVEAPAGSNFIFSIQVTGKNQPEHTKIDGIGLGSKLEDVKSKLGHPTEERPAVDQVTRGPIPETYIHYYGESLSFESTKGFISSVKILFDSTHSSDKPGDEKNFQANTPKEIQLVRDYLLNEEYPETFNGKQYRVAIIDFKIIDLDLDGINEVVVGFKPHYLQTPTIQIFKINENHTVERITEGLAPGPLVKRGDYFLDSHTLGLGMDATAKEKNGEDLSLGKTILSMGRMNMAVDYNGFTHIDNREGKPIYLDMKHLDPYDESRNCANFEFSMIEGLLVGYTEGDNKKGFISALIGTNAYFYTINSISREGFLDKTLKIISMEKE